MVEWDKNAIRASNVASRDRLMVASYYNFMAFPTSMALIVRAIFVLATIFLVTISLLLLLSNPPSQNLNTFIPKNLPRMKTPTYHKGL
jgi:hypothetical protein